MAMCKLCFNQIKDSSFIHLFHPEFSLCTRCYSEMQPVFKHFFALGYHATTIYFYSEAIRSRLYQLKGCYDYEIRTIFLERYKTYFRLKYHGYTIVPAPSYKEDNERREFNHVIEIFRVIGLPILNLFMKTEHHKQTEQTNGGRQEIGKYIKLVENLKLSDKKILLVDDVYTSGSTMKTLIRLIEPLKPKSIKVLVMSKTKHY